MKILYKGNVFNPTGIATANREIVKELSKHIPVQVSDIWHDAFEFNEGLEYLNSPINVNSDDVVTIFADYPQFWRDGYGKLVGHFLHEGTRLFPTWAGKMNASVEKMFVPSNAVKNLFKWNGVIVPMKVIPYGVNPEIYKPLPTTKDKEFIFLSINSWTLKEKDRKGIDVLIKAFDEEFKEEENVKLLLKVSTFWRKTDLPTTIAIIRKMLGHDNKNILVNTDYVPEKKLVEFYQKSDCFVMPTRGEGFGLTALNSLATGLPLIITKDKNSGHMDFCKDLDSVLWIDIEGMEQADPEFYTEGNMQPLIDKESLKKQMRYAYENRDKLREKAIKNSETIRKKYTWEETAKKIIEFLEE